MEAAELVTDNPERGGHFVNLCASLRRITMASTQ
ncbi:hypothetical protein LEMLEM_LOCUS4724 [Lemmus lemmus]